MYNCPLPWYTVVDEMSVDEMSVDEVSYTKCPQTNCRGTESAGGALSQDASPESSQFEQHSQQVRTVLIS